MTASANASGASCGGLCPMPPVRSRCAYLPENLLAYDAGSGWGAPLASPSKVIVGTVMTGAAASCLSRSLYFDAPSAEPEAPAVVMDHQADMIRVVERPRAPIERRVVKAPLRGRSLPDKLRKLMAVFFIPSATSVGCKVGPGTTIPAPPFAGNGILLASRLRIKYPLTETIALQRAGQSAATMLTVRAPQSNPARIALLDSERIHERDAVGSKR